MNYSIQINFNKGWGFQRKGGGDFCSKWSFAWLMVLPGRRRQALLVLLFRCLQTGDTSYLFNSNHLLHFWHRRLHINVFLSEQHKLKNIENTFSKTLEKTLSVHWDTGFKYLTWICPPIYCKVYSKVSSLFWVMINGFEKAFFSCTYQQRI